MPTHCPACKKPVSPTAEACPYCPMSFKAETPAPPKPAGKKPARTHCPACQKPVPPDAEVCPFCPMSFREEELEGPRKRRSDFSIPALAYLALFAVLGYGAWQGLGWVLRAANPLENPPAAPEADQGEVLVEKAVPGKPFPPPAEQPKTPSWKKLLKTAPPPEDDGGTVAITPVEPEKAAPKNAPPPVKEWRLRGSIADLATLAPVSGCSLVFSDVETNARYETMTDAQGRYRVILPPLPGRGYSLQISKEGYASNYLKAKAEDVRPMSAEKRRALALETARSLEGPASLAPEGSAPLLTDFFLAPSGAGAP